MHQLIIDSRTGGSLRSKDHVTMRAGCQSHNPGRCKFSIPSHLHTLTNSAQNTSIGGVWAENKLYPGLKTNNLHGGIDYTDFPMHEGFGIGTEQHVTGQTMHDYIEAYAQKHDLIKRIQFSSKVKEVSQPPIGSGWRLVISTPDDEVIETRKLIVATGVTNEPHKPTIKGSDVFAAPNFHSCEMGQYHTQITQDPSVRTVAVLGGGKSAYDAVYLAATRGRNVEWVIRKSGKGPAWVFPAHTHLGPIKVRREVYIFRIEAVVHS